MWEFFSNIVTLMGMLWASANWARWYAEDEPADPAPKRVRPISRVMYPDEQRDVDKLTNDGNLLDSVLMESPIEDYLFLRRVRGGAKA